MKVKNLVSMLLVVALMLSLSLTAFAKTSSDPIDDPADATEVFYVKVGAETYAYTWADVNGTGAFTAKTDDYAAKVDDEQSSEEWTGIMLADILADVQEKSGVTFEDGYKIKAVAADDYVVSFTVEEAQDADNRYMVAGDSVSNYDDETAFDNSYIRILRGDLDTTSNLANIRCLLGIEILDADGNALGGDIAEAKKTQGGNVAESVFYIAVQESADSEMKFYYYTLEELKAYDETFDFAYNDHSVDKTVTGKGASIASLLANIGDAEITDDMIIQYAESDGYHADKDTPIEDSAYKDKVSWMKETHVDAGGDTAAAVNTMVCYESWTVYAEPNENNVNSTEWEDADMDSGYLRAYRQRDDANSAVIKTLMGIVVTYNGQVFTGRDGYTLKAVSDKGAEIELIEPSTGNTYLSQSITGLVPGMEYAVKAPSVNNADLTAGEAEYQVVTAIAGSGDLVVTFTYTENTYFTLNTKEAITAYTYKEFMGNEDAVQVPTKEEVEDHGAPYGYYDAMYYRYNGVWLDDLVGQAEGEIVITDENGNTLTIAQEDAAKYFVAYGYTASKSATNVDEGKRFSYAYGAPCVIIPSDGTLVGEDEAANEGNKMVTFAMEDAKTITVDGGSFAGFADMAGFDWAVDAVNGLYELGVVKGTSDTTYGPGQQITRGDFMLMLYRAYDLTAEVDGNFADVPEDSYYYTAIAVAKTLGIAKGDGENFKPQESITRQDAMVLLYRTMELEGITLETGSVDSFADAADVADYAIDAVGALVQAGIIKGDGVNLMPKNNMTRAEMAVALYRALTEVE